MKTYLEERIEWYDDNYRNGNALISDKQFDQLEKNLLRTNPNCDYFKKKNKLVLPSLEKDSIDEFLKGLLVDTRLLIEPKIDGCAVALQYRDGTLEKAISRKGADVTSKLIKVQDIPNNLPLRGVLQVRGELYAPNQSPNMSQTIASLPWLQVCSRTPGEILFSRTLQTVAVGTATAPTDTAIESDMMRTIKLLMVTVHCLLFALSLISITQSTYDSCTVMA